MFETSDADYADFKGKVRELARGLGRPDAATRIVKDFALYLVDFVEHTDRAIGILVGVALEEASRELLEGYLVKDDSTLKLLRQGEALDSHAARIRLAYALGLLPEWMRDDLLTLRDIRNECAHRRAAYFGKNPIAEKIARLHLHEALDAAPQLGDAVKTFGSKERATFALTAGLLWLYLRTWSSVVSEEFRCVPLERLKASELRAKRRHRVREKARRKSPARTR